MILHVHKEMTDSLNLVDCANDSVGSSEHHLSVFGKFFLTINVPIFMIMIINLIPSTRMHQQAAIFQNFPGEDPQTPLFGKWPDHC